MIEVGRHTARWAPEPGGRRTRTALTYFLPALIPFVAGFLLFPVSGTDDKYITYWSAHALATLGEIVNYNGERVEQSSSLTHVAILAALARALPLSLPALGWLVSVFFGVATVPLTQRLAARLNPRLIIPAGLLTGSAVSLVYWSFGGLEATLAAFLGVALLLVGLRALSDGFTFPNTMAAATVTLLFVGVRPEAVCVAAAAWLGVMMLPVMRRLGGRGDRLPIAFSVVSRAALLLLAALVSCAALVVFRYVYFGDIVPQPVRAKVSPPELSAIADGLRYLLMQRWQRWDQPLWLLALAGAAALLIRVARGIAPALPGGVVALFLCAQLGFVVLAGGDWMEAGRFVVPVVPCAAILTAWVLAQVRAPQLRRGFLAALVATQLLACVDVARRQSPTGPLWATTPAPPPGTVLPLGWFDTKNRVHEHLIPVTARLLELLSERRRDDRPRGPSQPMDQRVTIASGQMGFVPFYVAQAFFGHVRFVDMGGLVTRDVTQLPPAYMGRSPTGVLFWYHHLFSLLDGPDASWLDPPDILFDYDLTAGPDAQRPRQAEAHGYSVVFRQLGFPSNGSALLPGRSGWRDAFIVARPASLSPEFAGPDEFRFTR